MSTAAGDGIVIITLSVVLGIVGYHVIGWWAPGLIIGSYVVGTIVNTILQRLQTRMLNKALEKVNTRWH
jgi:hypothetical protein